MDNPGRYAAPENDATEIRSFDVTLVHGLLQTEDWTTPPRSSRRFCPTTPRRR